VTVAAVLALAATAAGVADPPCRPDIAALTAPALFARYPALAAPPARWHAPDVRRGEARTFRTVLRRYGRAPADFAGRYRIVPIGCGAGAVCPAFVDGESGQVRFDPALRVAAALSVEAAGAGFETLTYRPDSRLLVVIGAANEDAARRGVTYYEWRGGRLAPLAFLPLAGFCAGRRAM